MSEESVLAPMSAGPATDVPPDEDLFRRAVARFATGVCVLSTRWSGRDHAMTANAFMSVSLDPLLVVVSVERDARFHDAVLETGVWGISVLPASARATAAWLATPGRPLFGQLGRVDHHPGPVTGVALVDDALATLECRTHAVHPAGDHSLVVGLVVGVGLPDDAEVAHRPPLVYQRSTYRQLR